MLLASQLLFHGLFALTIGKTFSVLVSSLSAKEIHQRESAPRQPTSHCGVNPTLPLPIMKSALFLGFVLASASDVWVSTSPLLIMQKMKNSAIDGNISHF